MVRASGTMKGMTILGSTGSIGGSTLDVLAQHAGEYRIVALTANQNVDRMLAQCQQFKPTYAVMMDADAATKLDYQLQKLSSETVVLSGIEGLCKVVALDETDYVMAAIVGAAGLQPTLAAARAGKRILLANKEALVMSGKLFMDEVKRHNAELLPIDSEHNAIFQCMPAEFAHDGRTDGVTKILLTASGGPFRTLPVADLNMVTPEQACAHPNWVMGRKISVDSASMMNKGLEVIEACWLFGISPEMIQVVIHPQSVIHSMVEYTDGSVLAQLGQPDMRTPIAHALAWPKRMRSGVERLDLFKIRHLDFEAPDLQRFPCLRLAYEAIRTGGTAPSILNAANEVAVQAFLDRLICFTDIPALSEHVLGQLVSSNADSLDSIIRVDNQSRELAQEYVKRLSTRQRRQMQ